jgi:predicted SnoaL-like aldol condensation-catalyzing enzyme
LAIGVLLTAALFQAVAAGETVEDANSAIARRFYQQVWFSNHMEAVDELVAPHYFVHDIGGLEGVEPASMQKEVAGFFWNHGTMSGSIDFQIAHGDLVMTRWFWHFRPTTWWMKLLGGRDPLPIVNVMRIRDGKIVEFWNHRHDIDSAAANLRIAGGAGAGLLCGCLVGAAALAFVSRRRRGRASAQYP